MQKQDDINTQNRQDTYETKPFSSQRQVVVNYLAEAKRKHTIYAVFEIDITTPRMKIEEIYKKTNRKISFTAYIARCLAIEVSKNKYLHAYRKGKKKLILFDEVDVAAIVEREIEEKKVPTNYIIRNANNKSLLAIHDEIRNTVKAGDKKIASNGSLNIAKIPSIIRKWIFRKVRKDPYFKKKHSGTIGLTAVGMFANGAGWGLQITPHTMSVSLGGMEKKPAVIDNQIVIREFLSVSIAFDHDIIDGAPGAKFCSSFRELVASGQLLTALEIELQ